MTRRTRNVIAAVITGSAMATVLVGTMQSSVPFVTPAQLDDGLDGRRVQVEGVVETIAPEGDRLLIVVSDGASATVDIDYAYADQRPLTLEVGRVVVAKGLYRGGVVEAFQVSVRAHEQ